MFDVNLKNFLTMIFTHTMIKVTTYIEGRGIKMTKKIYYN